MQLHQSTNPAFDREPWVDDLRERFVDAGYDGLRVDELLTAALARFRAARLRSFIPLLVERSVQQALRD